MRQSMIQLRTRPGSFCRLFVRDQSSLPKGSRRLHQEKPTSGAKQSIPDVVKSSSGGKQSSRIDRLILRSPKFMHRHLQTLRSAPLTHITAFLILHELTAVIPLFGLAGAFHYYHWLPPYFAEGAWVVAGVEKFGRYARRKGWISAGDELEAEREARSGDAASIEGGLQSESTSESTTTGKWFGRGESGVRWVVEFGTAYAIVKAFLIPRMALSIWAAPWFAQRSVVPIVNLFKRIRTRTGPNNV